MSSQFELIKNNWKNLISELKINYLITDIAFKTFIVPMNPNNIENGTLFIKCPNEEIVNILEVKYKTILQVQIEETLGLPIDVKFIPDDNIIDVEPNEFFYTNNLNPKFTFETFVRGENNALAYAAALNISEKPGTSYNPFFIYGGAGLGKTHLMNAIAHKIIKNDSSKKVLYVTSEQFTNELIDSIRSNTKSNIAFRNKYRNIDVLLIDDIQFIIGKESTQEEFFHTFNTLFGANKQIIISSDKPPKELEILEDRLKSRFQSGLIVDIQVPNFETRMAILKLYEDNELIHFPNEVLEYIANNITSNIRTLEGTFLTLVASTRLIHGNANNITLDVAKQLLKDIITPSSNIEITIEYILEVVAQYYKVTVDDIISKSKNKKIATIRHIAIYLCHQLTDYSLKDIGKVIGNRDHSTIIYSRNEITKNININKTLKNEIDSLSKKIKP